MFGSMEIILYLCIVIERKSVTDKRALCYRLIGTQLPRETIEH